MELLPAAPARAATVVFALMLCSGLAVSQNPPQQPARPKSPFEEVQETKPQAEPAKPQPPQTPPPKSPFEAPPEEKKEAPPAAPPAAPGAKPAARQDLVENIEFRGNRRIPRDTLLSRLYSKKGDPYDEDQLRRDFMLLWNTGFFDDVRLEVEPGTLGQIIRFVVVERRMVRTIK